MLPLSDETRASPTNQAKVDGQITRERSVTARRPVADLHGLVSQLSLLGGGEPAFDARFRDLRHIDLGAGAWLQICPNWLSGHDTLFATLADRLGWVLEQRPMYDRIVDVPRLLASPMTMDISAIASSESAVPHPIITELSDALSRRYATPLDQVGFALYRNGQDSVAWHGDRIGRSRSRSIVATLSLGERRRFLLRPTPGRSAPPRRSTASCRFDIGHGDLLVMGGTAQRTWQHTVPKAAEAGPRLVVMFRHEPHVGVSDSIPDCEQSDATPTTCPT